MAIEGVDYAFGPHPDVAALAAAGKKFAVRYGGPGTEGKWIHADEAAELAAHGIAIVANAEGSTSGLIAGFSAGASWARSADTWFRGIGMPAGRPIYFSVDFDTTSGDWDELDAAMDGAASVIGRARVGVYGEYSIVAHLIGNGKARWAWETYGWSAGRWFPGNHIEQYRNGVVIGGAQVDLNRAMQADYGQWFPGGNGPLGEDMSDAYELINKGTRLEGSPTYTPAGPDGKRYGSLSNAYAIEAAQKAAVDARIAADNTAALLERVQTGGVDVAELAKALAPLMAPLLTAGMENAAEAAVRKVLGEVDGATPPKA